MTTAFDLLRCICTHLAEFELPALWSVDVTTSSGGTVSAQLACHQPPEIAAGLLAWADTLSEITAESWRVPSGDSVRLSVIGQLPSGITIRIYGGVPYTGHGIGTDLAPGTHTTVPLAALRAMAAPGEVTI
jgi:hypothetical protein